MTAGGPPPQPWGFGEQAWQGRPGPAAGGYPPYPPEFPGGLARRFLARLADGILVSLIAGVLSFFVFGDRYPFLVTGLFSGVLTFGYFVLCETTWGSSAGKRLFGLRVRGAGGAPNPDAAQSAKRNAFTLLAVVPYLGPLLAVAAYLTIAVTIGSNPARQGIHDGFAGGTRVVRS